MSVKEKIGKIGDFAKNTAKKLGDSVKEIVDEKKAENLFNKTINEKLILFTIKNYNQSLLSKSPKIRMFFDKDMKPYIYEIDINSFDASKVFSCERTNQEIRLKSYSSEKVTIQIDQYAVNFYPAEIEYVTQSTQPNMVITYNNNSDNSIIIENSQFNNSDINIQGEMNKLRDGVMHLNNKKAHKLFGQFEKCINDNQKDESALNKLITAAPELASLAISIFQSKFR